jgi:hypothetical protein
MTQRGGTRLPKTVPERARNGNTGICTEEQSQVATDRRCTSAGHQGGPRQTRTKEYAAGIQVHVEDLAAHIAGRERGDGEARWNELMPAYRDLAVAGFGHLARVIRHGLNKIQYQPGLIERLPHRNQADLGPSRWPKGRRPSKAAEGPDGPARRSSSFADLPS